MKTSRIIHSCIEKRAYPSEGEARRVMYRVMLQTGKTGTLDMRAKTYECPFGNHYHFGRVRIQKETKC